MFAAQFLAWFVLYALYCLAAPLLLILHAVMEQHYKGLAWRVGLFLLTSIFCFVEGVRSFIVSQSTIYALLLPAFQIAAAVWVAIDTNRKLFRNLLPNSESGKLKPMVDEVSNKNVE